MSKIYIVTEGEYSDYSINNVFSTEEKAKEFIAERGGGIEEFELDPDWRNEITNYIKGYFPFEVIYHYNTNEYKATKRVWSAYGNYKNYCMPYGSAEIKWTIKCIAQDEQHALKIASERIAQIKALNLINISFYDYWEIKFGAGGEFQDI